MSIFLLSLVAGIGAGYLFRGRIRHLGALRVSYGLLASVWFALTLQVALRWIRELIPGPNAEYALLIATYGVVAAALSLYFVELSRARPPSGTRAGVVVVAFGWLLNFAVIALNRGMPFSGTTSGNAELFLKHVPMSPDTELRFLGDVIYLAPLHEIVSAGDLVLALGLALYVCAAMKPVGRPTLTVPRGAGKGSV